MMATSSFVNAQLASCLANGLGSLCGATASSRMGGFGGFGGFGDLNSTGSSVYSTASSREHSISSIDSILSDMVSALEADNEPQCHECSETGVLAARCTSCEAVLCDACARAHQRLPVTMDHLLVRLDDALPYNMSVPPPSGAVVILPGFGGVPPPPPRSSRHSSRSPGAVRGAHSPTACEEHQGETVKVYCETCAAPICGVCIDSKTHHGHSLSYIQAAIEASRVTNMSYLADATSGAQTMQDRLDVTLKMVDAVDVKAKQVASEVRQASQRLVAAVEARERELLANVEKIRSLKSMSLLLQSETIRGLLKRFVRLADSLRDSLQQDSIDALHTKEKASVELTQLCAARANVTASGATPFEDDLLTFVPHEPLLVRAISSAGAVTSSPYALTTLAVGEGLSRATRGRQASFTVHIKNHLNEAATPGSVDYVEATLVAPNGGVTHADVEDRGDGSLTVVYQPRVEGPNTLNVTLRGRHIAGSPFQVAVRAVRTYDGLLPPVTFGGEGGDDGQLLRPWGICCDRQGRLIVADRSNNRIQVFQPDGTFLFKFGSQGKEPGQFDRPAGVAADAAGRIVVADKDNHRVQVFDSDGQFVLAFGEMGSNNGQFHYPWDVDANAAGQIVVSDTRNHRIQLFSPTGQFLKKYGWETSTTMWKHFDTPRGVSFNPNNFVIVTDFNNHRLVVVEPSFRNARFLGSEGTDVKQFMRPQGVVVDDSGNIIVADSRNNRVQVLESNGTFRCQIGLPDVQMDRPSGVCVTPEGRIAIVDFGNNRVVMC